MNALGECFEKGIGVAVNMIKAIQFYKKSSEIGNLVAMKNLGECYENGFGVQVNVSRAIQLYKKILETWKFRSNEKPGRML